MQSALLWTVLALCAALSPAQASLKTDQEGFLEDVTCNDAADCYVKDGELALACWYSVKKCKFQNTYQSIYSLQTISNECVMSKYGPCGKKGEVEVGCSDGFECINGKCLDPKEPTKIANGPVEFQTGSCKACQFSDDLQLQCDGFDSGAEKCLCQKVYIADGRGTLWDLRNYDGDKNCSAGQFGPCGEHNGVKIECHGEGISCVDGTCVNPEHPKSVLNGPCQEDKNCDATLICSHSRKCIQPNTTPSGESCNTDAECVQGTSCKRDPRLGPWSSPKCQA